MSGRTIDILKRGDTNMSRLGFLAGVVTTLSVIGLLQAQSPNASLTGRFTDPSKAIIVEVRDVAINVGTNIRYETVTNEVGEYYMSNLPPGTYRLEAQKAGFDTVIKPDVVLHVQEAVEINFEMMVGSTSESITVTGGAPTVQTATPELGAVIDSQTVRELPLNGRSWTDLATLQSGVTLVVTQINYTTGSGRGNRGFG
jgi:hypothetical protein